MSPRFSDANLAHSIERSPFRHGDRIAVKPLSRVGKILDFNKYRGCARMAGGNKLRLVLTYAFGTLQHERGAIARQNDEAQAVSLGYLHGFLKTHTLHPEGQRLLYFFHDQDWCDLHPRPY